MVMRPHTVRRDTLENIRETGVWTQNTASALIYDLALDWREGAMWFEKQLLDYDPASNYGNWQYIAGIVANSRGGSRFNLQKQQALYDAEGLFVKTWSQSLNRG